jgi:hypothetical protein
VEIPVIKVMTAKESAMAEKIKMYRFPLRDKFRYAKNANIGLHSIITIFLWQYNGEEWIFLSF